MVAAFEWAFLVLGFMMALVSAGCAYRDRREILTALIDIWTVFSRSL